MNKPSLLLALLAAPLPAHAAGTRSSGQVLLEYTDFTRTFGDRQVATLEYDLDFGDTRVVFTGAQGRREYASDTFNATRGGVSVTHDWSDRFYTRTSASVATNDPVFPTFDAQQEFNFRVTPDLVLQAGGRYTRYYGGRDAVAWSGGATYFFRGGSVSYRYTGYDVEGLSGTHGHTASLRVDDPRGRGFTQLWLGTGTNVQEYEALPAQFTGDYHNIAIRRVQPLSGNLALSLGLSHTWYDTGLVEYQGTSVRLGLGLNH